MFKIMIIEDDEILREQICLRITQWGYEAIAASSFDNLLNEFVKVSPHLLLLDINLPGANGFKICEEIRRTYQTPIIFISSRNSNMDIITGINLGADDYLQKPFSLDILIAKIEGLLRRTYKFAAIKSNIISCNNVILDIDKQTISNNEESIELTSNEIKIITELMRNKGKVISRDKLMEKLWNVSWFVDDSTLTVNINRLRNKLKSIGLSDFIQTKRGQGYLIGE